MAWPRHYQLEKNVAALIIFAASQSRLKIRRCREKITFSQTEPLHADTRYQHKCGNKYTP